MKQKLLLSGLGLALILNISCKKGTSDEDTSADASVNAVETAMSEAGSNATAAESAGSVGFSYNQHSISNFVDPQDSVHPFSACTYSSVRGACSSSSDTISWNGCTVAGGAVTLTGQWTEAFFGTGASTCAIPVGNGETVTRTSAGSTMTFASGAALVTDTNGGTAWDGTVIPSTGTSIVGGASSKAITIHGTHRKLTGPAGRTLFDHFVTSTGLTSTGSRAGGNRVMTGSVSVYHNLAKYTATNTFNSVTWGSANCCYPTSGNISSSFSGSVTGNTTLTFSSTCGSATFADSSGTSNVTLTQCN
jgi:hypothetical protein